VSELLSEEEVATRLQTLSGWERVDDGGPAITATYKQADFAGALAFVNALAAEAEAMDHHPDIDIRWNTVTLTLSTHSEGGLTAKDFELASRISRILQPQ
jgi:4a-hydroxytetrahydrobiopterin dehydratase